MGRPRVARVALLALTAATIAGCAGDPPPEKVATKPEPTLVRVALQAAADVNPDPKGAPSLLSVRLYLLRSQGSFAASDFFGLWDDEQKVIGRDLVRREELVVKPGQSAAFDGVAEADARVLGVAAAYQDIERATWRAAAPLEAARSNGFEVRLARRGLALTRIEAGKPQDGGTTDGQGDKQR